MTSNVLWSFSSPPADLTNSTAYKTRYTNNATLTPIPTGSYSITFPAVTGYVTATAATNIIWTSPLTNSITGAYVRACGTITVTVSHVDGSWTFTNYPSDYTNYTASSLGGTNSGVITNAPVGSYRIHYGSVSGYTNPADETRTSTTADTNLTFYGLYTLGASDLTIRFQPPAVQATALWWVDNVAFPSPQGPYGHNYVKTLSPSNDYTVTYGAVHDYYYSALTQIVNFVEDQIITNTYLPYTNSFRIVVYDQNTNAINASWVISNYPSAFTNSHAYINQGSNGTGEELYSTIPTGTYQVAFSAYPLYAAPGTASFTITGDMAPVFTGIYTKVSDVLDTDGDRLPDAWESAWGLNPYDATGDNGWYGNPDGDWIPSYGSNPPVLISISSNLVMTYLAADGSDPGYPLRGLRLYDPATNKQAYARTNLPFYNGLECRGFDGIYTTNGSSGWVPDDDSHTDPGGTNRSSYQAGVGFDTTKPGPSQQNKVSDGWKYYFWYWRAANGLSNSANLSWVLISPANMVDFENDTDNDGVKDGLEYTAGLDPTHADTDADSMDDYWERQYSTVCNPYNYLDGMTNTDNDFYAYHPTRCVLTNGTVGTLLTNNVYYAGSSATAVATAWIEKYTNSGVGCFDLYRDQIISIVGRLTNGIAGTLYIHSTYYGTTNLLSGYKSGYPVWVDNDDNGTYSAGDTALVNPLLKHEGLYMYLVTDATALPGITSFDPRTAWSLNLADINGHTNTLPYVNYMEYQGGDYLGRCSWLQGGNVPSVDGNNDGDGTPSTRNAYSNPSIKDTDADVMPDGWELYTGLNPNSAADAGEDPDGDGLANSAEWANSSDTNGSVGTWTNKIWPTDPGFIEVPAPNDPHPADTDWDGLPDGGELGTLSNPTMVDTDTDGLPDGWEAYAGTAPIISDANLDSDSDGLLNWQEYWTGTVPEWMECDPDWGMLFLARRFMPWNPPATNDEENPYTTFGDPIEVDTRWFMPPDFLTCPSFLYANGAVTDLAWLRANFPAADSGAGYHTTIAGSTDGDVDAMDDYWEVFHCLNPIRGYLDLNCPGATTYAYMFRVGATDADPNTPGNQVGTAGNPFTSIMDLVLYYQALREITDLGAQAAMLAALIGPHNFGLEGMDPDNDGLTSFDEYLYYRASRLLHTCPSPLWRTDPYLTGHYAFVSRNYTRDNTTSLGGWNDLGFSGITYSESRGSTPFRWAAMAEGYDTDNDLISDYEEVTGYRTNGVVAGTDPLLDESPLKNRVFWLDGTNSWGRSYAWSAYGDWTRFSVEAWVRPSRVRSTADQVIFEKTSLHQFQNRDGSFASIALANVQLGISTNGLPYVLFHDISGLNTNRALAADLSLLEVNKWVHLAGVFDGTNLTLYVNGEASATHHTTAVPARGIEGDYVWHANCNLSVGARELDPGWHFPLAGANYFAGCIDEVRVWDRVLSAGEIKARKDRRLTAEEIGTVLPGNDGYLESGSNLFAYYRFTDLPDPKVDGTVPSGFPINRSDRPASSRNYSDVYTNYLVIAKDLVQRIPRLPPRDTRVIDGTPVATSSNAPDGYGISTTDYLAITNNLPPDFNNSANPYNFTHWTYGIDMGRGMWLVGKAQGLKTNTWLATLTDDPDSTDADGDGLPDWWEQLYGLNMNDATGDNGAWGDPDYDGLNNRAEYLAGTNPKKSDTDGDGIGDYDSRRGPGSRTWGELYDDGDGMPDIWEVQYGLDPNYYDANLDSDNDGWSNYTEYQAGTNPKDAHSHPAPTVTGSLSYAGTNAATLRILGYQTNTMDGVPAASTSGSTSSNFSLTGFKEGDFYLFGYLDINGNSLWNSGEPCGVTHPQPVTLSWSSLTEINLGIRDTYPGYGRFAWTAPAATADVAVVINKISESGAPPVISRSLRSPRYFFHEWDYQLAGLYGLSSGSYQWWVGTQNGTFQVTWPSSVSKPTLVYPRGDMFYYARNQIAWTMDQYATCYHLQIADASYNMITNCYLPAPYPGANDVYRDTLPFYMGEWANGPYFWRIASWNPAGESEWSDVQTFNIDLTATNSYWISGDIHYFGKARATNIYVEAFNNPAFGGEPEARMFYPLSCTTNALKTAYILRGLQNKTYYIRAFTDISPAGGGSPNGQLDYWESWGFVKDTYNDYQPRAIDMTNTHVIEDAKVVIRDRDTDNDHLPDAWEISYFGNLDQTGDMDYDGDGENNLTEYALDFLDTDPTLFDTDCDGLTDYYEHHYGNNADYDPYDAAGNPAGKSLNPTRWDTDGDAYSDGSEIRRYHTNPLDPASRPGYAPLCVGPAASSADYDGDGRTDVSVYDPANGMWYILTWNGQSFNGQFGSATTQPLMGDFDGDGRTDAALYDTPSGTWYVYTMQGQFGSLAFGDSQMIPVPADYNGDFKTDLGVFDMPTGMWYLYAPFTGQFTSFQFGNTACIPAPGDYDGDGKYDLAVYHVPDNTWYVYTWRGQFTEFQFGRSGCIPVPGDYDGDGRYDFAVYEVPSATWYICTWNQQVVSGQFGWNGVIPVPGDYDGDGRRDAGVYDPASGMWFVYTIAGQQYQGQFGAPPAGPVLRGR